MSHAASSLPVAGQPAADLLAQVRLPVPGLYRRHEERNLGAVAAAILAAYLGQGPVRLGDSGNLVVIAVDGLGYSRAARALRPDVLTPLISEFPTTTIACLLSAVTGRHADEHGFIGVQYLHADGRRTVNCHDGQVAEPTGPGRERPTQTPVLPTVFDLLARAGIKTVALPAELAGLDADVRDRLLHGASVVDGPLSAMPPDPADLVCALSAALAALVTTSRSTLTWAYLDLDTHVHRHGFDERRQVAEARLDQLAQRLRAAGAAVLIFSDHGLTRNAPSAATLAAWQEAAGPRWCRLPAGGAGRTRWIYPQPRHEDRLTGQLAAQVPDAVVAGPEQLAQWGLVTPGSIGQRRLGEIVLLARGPDFPAPDTSTSFEHGSMTAEEVLIPMAIWQAGR